MRDFALIERSVQLGYDINFRNGNNKTLLMEAVDLYLNIPVEDKNKREFLFLIEALLKFGVKVTQQQIIMKMFFSGQLELKIKILLIFFLQKIRYKYKP